jgi:hypothetical protein
MNGCYKTANLFLIYSVFSAITVIGGQAAIAISHPQDQKTPPPTPRVAMLIGDLASNKSRTRHEAMNRLIDSGKTAVAELVQAIPDGDLDFRIRGIQVLQQLGMDDDLDLSIAAENALISLSEHKEQRVAQLANKSVTALFKSKEASTLKMFQDNGATIRSETEKIGLRYHYPLSTLIIDESWKGDDSQLAQVRYLRNVMAIEFVGQRIDDQLIETFPSSSELVSIAFKKTMISNETIRILSRFKKLERIEVHYSEGVTIDCLESLKNCESLSEIKFYGTGVSVEERADFEFALKNAKIDIRRGGFLGIQYTATAPICQVTRVVDNSGAEKAGIKVGDVIVEYAGQKVEAPASLSKVISDHKVGEAVKVKVSRQGKLIVLDVSLTRWQ